MKLFLALLSLCIPVLCVAEGEKDKDHPCAADHAKLCPGMKPGDGKLGKCMKEHEAELSPACKSKAHEMKDKMKEHMKAAREACEGDREKFCKSEKPGGGAIVKCLKSHEAELSAACKESLPKHGPRK